MEERAERAGDEIDALGHRRLSQVALTQVEKAGDTGFLAPRAAEGQHAFRVVDADHANARLRGGDGDAPRADAELDDRPRGLASLGDVELDVLGDASA